jgi:hypothetical protein
VDAEILNPGTVGSLFGGFSLSKVIVEQTADVSVLLVDPEQEAVVINGPLYYGKQDVGNVSDISDLLVQTPTMGIIQGGGVTIVSGRDLQIGSGFGYINTGTFPNDNLVRIEWTTQNYTFPANARAHIFINPSGNVAISASYPNTVENIYLGLAISNTTDVLNVENIPVVAQHYSNAVTQALREAIGPVFSSGCLTVAVGTRNLQVTAGRYYYGEVQLNPAGANPITFYTAWKSTTPGLYNTLAGQTTASNTEYDDGSGTLASIPAGKFVKHLLIVVGGPSEQYVLVYGDTLFDTLIEAQNAAVPDTGAFNRGSFARIASVVVQEGASAIQAIIDERPRIGFASSSSVSGVSSHSALANLTNDDHLQYFRTDGTRLPTADFNMNGFNITNIGTVDGVDVSLINNPRQMSYFFDDFIVGQTFSGAWTISASGTGASAQIGAWGLATIQGGGVGILECDTGTTATGRISISKSISPTNGFELGHGRSEVTWRFALQQPSDGTNRYVIYAGLIDNVNAGASVDGCYFAYSDSLNPNWLCVTRSNNVQTTIDSGIPYFNRQRRYTVVVNEDATSVDFFIEGVLVANSTTNIPSGAARRTGIGIKMEKLLGTTQRSFDLDYFEGKFFITGGR